MQKIVNLSIDAGIDAIKLQTFVPEEMVFNIKSNKFKISNKKIFGMEIIFDFIKSLIHLLVGITVIWNS